MTHLLCLVLLTICHDSGIADKGKRNAIHKVDK